MFGIAVGVLGAIIRFAVGPTATGFDSDQAGIVILVAGIAGAFVAVIWLVVGIKKRSTPEDGSRPAADMGRRGVPCRQGEVGP